MIDSAIVVFAIQAAIRLARAGNQALTQYARDREVLLPSVVVVPQTLADHVFSIVSTDPTLIPENMKAAFEDVAANRQNCKRENLELMAAFADDLEKENNGKEMRLSEGKVEKNVGYWMVQQWSKDTAPISPLARFAISLADIAVGYIALEPSLVHAGGRAEPLIQALAENIGKLLPDETDPLAPGNQLGQQLASIFLESGLRAIAAQPGAVFGEAKLKILAAQVLPALADHLPKDLAFLSNREAALAMLGPVSQAAIGALAGNQQAFLGRKFADATALGTFTQLFLKQVADNGINASLGKEGLTDFYHAALNLLAERPDLIVGQDTGKTDSFLRAMIADSARILDGYKGQFDEAALRGLTASALEVAGKNGLIFLRNDGNWSPVVSGCLDPILSAFRTSLQNNNTGALKALLSGDSLTGFARIFLQQVAQTPGMVSKPGKVQTMAQAVADAMAQDKDLLLTQDGWLTLAGVAADKSGYALLSPLFGAVRDYMVNPDGTLKSGIANRDFLIALLRVLLEQLSTHPGMLVNARQPELRRIVATIASGMTKDQNLLLTREDWLAIAAAVAAEAASNPDRLFGLDPNSQESALVLPLITGLLDVANKQWQDMAQMPATGPILFGTTLREAILAVCQVAAGNIAAAAARSDQLTALAKGLSDTVAQHPRQFGSREWLFLYRLLLPDVIAGKPLPDLDAAKLGELLGAQK